MLHAILFLMVFVIVNNCKKTGVQKTQQAGGLKPELGDIVWF